MFSLFPDADWIRTPSGRKALAQRSGQATEALIHSGLPHALAAAHRASRRAAKAIRKRDPLLRTALEEIHILALAHAHDVAIPAQAWRVAHTILSAALDMDALACQGRFSRPAWKADLSTADLGVTLAFLATTPSPLAERKNEIAEFLRVRCWDPAAAEWLDDRSRIHCLDSMGHNWWSVIVGGAGVVAALLGWEDEAQRAVAGLDEWFRYPGNASWRKHPNFGPEGDFVEGFLYCDYALIHPFLLAALRQVEVVPAWLNIRQCQGLAAWYRRSFVGSPDTPWPVRFGDTGTHYLPRASVWHELARLAGDRRLLNLARRIVPEPRHPLDFLFWRSRLTPSRPAKDTPAVFPTSGYAFLGGDRLALAVRAGEFWNHNHLDAGTFVLSQDGAVWADDAGTCPYAFPEYVSYYSAPAAHNVAYAPRLVPPLAPAKELGLDLEGEFLAHGRQPALEFLHVDTRVLSGGSLLRSRRSFFVLDEHITVVWDDLEARDPERFESLLHTTRSVRRLSAHRLRLQDGPNRCTLLGFSDEATTLSITPAPLGFHPPAGELSGSCIRWRSSGKARRRKFLLALGTGLQAGAWREESGGWITHLRGPAEEWTLWFNRLADGRIAHRNAIARWGELETDAYALVIRKQHRRATLYACSASFVRMAGRPLTGSLRRLPLVSLALPFSAAPLEEM